MHQNLNVISCNFVIFGAIFMKFSPKCNTKSDIGKFVIKFGNFFLYLGKKGQITSPKFAKFALGKSLLSVKKGKVTCTLDCKWQP